jgi:hypothetical protein
MASKFIGRGNFLVFCQDPEAYTEVGLEVLAEIPQADAAPQEFTHWLKATRKMVKERMKVLEEIGNSDEEWMTDERPDRDPLIGVYELDLNNLVLHFDSFPLFRLDHVPPPDLFLQAIGYNHYGHPAVSKNTPNEYRYN